MRRDVQEIFKMTPHEKQVMMFSATLSKEIRPVCRKFMQDVSWMEINIKPPACSLFYHSVALQKFQSCLFAFLRLLLVHCFVEMPLVALPTCGCRCHKCPYQRGTVILPGTSHSARTLVCPGFAAAQENKISHSRLTVYIVYTRWELTWNSFVTFLSFSPWKCLWMTRPSWPSTACSSITASWRTARRTGSSSTCLTCSSSTRWGCRCLGKVHKTWISGATRRVIRVLLVSRQVVIFVKSVHRCVALSQLLVEQNFPAIAIHRGMAQEER